MIEILLAATFYYLISHAPPNYNQLAILQVYSELAECERMRRSQTRLFPSIWYFCTPSESPNLKTLVTEKMHTDAEQNAEMTARLREIQL